MNESGIISIVTILGMSSFYLEILFGFLILNIGSKKRKYFPIALILSLLLSIPIYFVPDLKLFDFNFNYFLMVILVFLIGILMYDEEIVNLLIISVCAWGIQHICWNLIGIVYDLIPNIASYDKISILSIHYSLEVFFYILIFFVFKTMKIKFFSIKKHLPLFIFGGIMIVATMFLSQKIEQWNITIRLYTTLLALSSLVIMIGYPYLIEAINREKNLKYEKNTLEKMLELQSKQQELSKETIDIVNMKFHDMKHQLLSLKNDDSNKDEMIDELEKSIDIYSDIARSENEALNIVLTQKSLLCSSKKIRFTYIVDGSLLSMISKIDITSLFGNILDNAIEGVSDEEGEYRLIKMKVFKQNEFIMIQEENYCHKKISFNKDLLPISSKNDEINHGYGTKSIRYITRKYHGQLSFKVENNVFYLNIVIPLK